MTPASPPETSTALAGARGSPEIASDSAGARVRCAPGTGLAAYDASPVTGRISDARERVQEVEGGPALDAVLIGSLQKTEQYYCIAAWGTARSLAESARESDVEMYGRAIKDGQAAR